MKTLTILNRKAPYFHALPAANILCGIQAVNYIVIIGTAKPSVIAETDEPAMLGKRQGSKKDLKHSTGFFKQCYFQILLPKKINYVTK
jgi:hypothetical protein